MNIEVIFRNALAAVTQVTRMLTHKILPIRASAFARFRDDRRGIVVLTTALTMLPLVFLMGAAIDFSRSTKSKVDLQTALDAALLAATKTDNSDATAFKSSVESLFGQPTSNTSVLRIPQVDGGYKYTGAATANVATAFMSLAGIKTVAVTADAEATMPGQIKTIKVAPTQTSGAYSKDIFIWTKDDKGNLTSRQKIITYRYSSSNGSKVTTPPLGSTSTTITVTANTYSKFGLGMVVYEDWQHYSGALINAKELWSDAANANTFLRQTGQCTDAGGAKFNWEDGGDANFADFVYTMTCTVGVAPGAVIRLSQ